MIELTERFLEKDIAVIEFSVKHSIYQLGSTDYILHNLHISYVTEACVDTMQGAQYTK